MLKRFAAVLAFGLIGLNAWANSNPTEVVSQATNGLIEELKQTPEADRSDDMVKQLVMTYIVPAIDQEKIAMGAMGKYWRLASPQQRTEFIERFRELQIHTYSGAFRAFSGEKLNFESARINDKGDRALVQGQLTQTNGNVIPIDFKLYLSDDGQWRVYDAVVSGLSMVKTYRDQMSNRLQGTNPGNASKRMDALLEELKQEAEQKDDSQNAA